MSNGRYSNFDIIIPIFMFFGRGTLQLAMSVRLRDIFAILILLFFLSCCELLKGTLVLRNSLIKGDFVSFILNDLFLNFVFLPVTNILDIIFVII